MSRGDVTELRCGGHRAALKGIEKVKLLDFDGGSVSVGRRLGNGAEAVDGEIIERQIRRSIIANSANTRIRGKSEVDKIIGVFKKEKERKMEAEGPNRGMWSNAAESAENVQLET